MTTQMKRCSCCGEMFPIDDFGDSLSTPDGKNYYTRDHASALQKKYRDENPERVKEYRRKYQEKVRARNLARRNASVE